MSSEVSEVDALTRLRRWVGLYRFEIGVALIAVLPIIVAMIRAVLSGYTPVNDDALVLLRSRDVLTVNHPFLGLPSSSSLSFGVTVSNPGPLLFDLMAGPVKLFGGGPGLALAVGALNIACIIGAACMAYRIRGRSAFLSFLVVASILAWGMGSELLFDVWQPHSLIFPFLIFLVLVWALACGRVLALPWAVGIGCYLLQTHLSYVYLVPALLGAGITIGLAARPRDRSVILRSIFWTGGVAALAWAQPLWEQFFGSGPGNLTRLFNAASGQYGSVSAYGSRLAVRVSAAVFAILPWRQRSGFAERLLIDPIPSYLTAALFLGALVVLLVLTLLRRKTLQHRPDRMATYLSLLLIAIALFSLKYQPVSTVGLLAPHQVRWLWPIASFILFTFLLRFSSGVANSRIVAGIFTSLIIVTAALNLPMSRSENLTPGVGESTPAAAMMINQVDKLRGRGTLHFVVNPVSFGEPFSSPLLAALAERGIPFLVADPILGGEVGERRRPAYCRLSCAQGASLSVANGYGAFEIPKGAERAIFVQGISTGELRTLKRIEKELLASGAKRDFQGMLIAKDAHDRGKATRYAELKRALVYGSVAVFLTPSP